MDGIPINTINISANIVTGSVIGEGNHNWRKSLNCRKSVDKLSVFGNPVHSSFMIHLYIFFNIYNSSATWVV
jgi:hypothetical protein